MKKFDYEQDTAYVVPALRYKNKQLPDSRAWRHKALIGLTVVLLHVLLGWALLFFTPKSLPLVEINETQVVLESHFLKESFDESLKGQQAQPVNQKKLPSALPRKTEVKKAVVAHDVVRAEVVLKKAERHASGESKSSVSTTKTSSLGKNNAIEKDSLESSVPPSIVSVKKLTNECHQASRLNLQSNLVERNASAQLMVRRNAQGRAISVAMQKSTGKAALDAWIERKVLASLRFVKKDAACEGLEMSMKVSLMEG